MAQLKKSPLAPKKSPSILAVNGVRLAAAEAKLRYQGRKDLMLAVFDEQTTYAGVYTRSKTAAAPVEWCQRVTEEGGNARVLVVNAGNANAFTGRKGRDACQAVAEAAAKLTGCKVEQVLLASTGVIGEPLNASPINEALPGLLEGLSESQWDDAAQAIMTTDTFPKAASKTFDCDGASITITGIAKGSGMIAPDMATMLGFVATDAAISQKCLQEILTETVYNSFNSITVDGDTSTNDCVLAFATGAAGNEIIDSTADTRIDQFKACFQAVMIDLAHQIVRDGEGAQKFVTVGVKGAESDHAAHVIGKSIANSPLVKTAIAGEDPNWGRIVMAVGKSGEAANRDALKIWIGKQLIAVDGAVHPDYSEEGAADYMKGQDIDITVDVGVGVGHATIWTCDLTHQYIDINADYRS